MSVEGMKLEHSIQGHPVALLPRKGVLGGLELHPGTLTCPPGPETAPPRVGIERVPLGQPWDLPGHLEHGAVRLSPTTQKCAAPAAWAWRPSGLARASHPEEALLLARQPDRQPLGATPVPVSYTHLRAHETPEH